MSYTPQSENMASSSNNNRRAQITQASTASNMAQHSTTQTQTQAGGNAQRGDRDRQPVLHLRGAIRREGEDERRPRIQWAEDVVDNEGLGRKSSKVCCIYHAPRGIDESSDESSDSSGDETDSGDDGAARMSGGKREHNHNHNHNHGNRKGKGRARSPNAYEKVPKPKGSGGGGGATQK